MGADSLARTALWLENLADELDGVALYEGLAALDDDARRARTFRHLADGERKHAGMWASKLASAGVAVPARRTSLRIRLLLRIARVFGVGAALPWVVSAETRDIDKYSHQGGDATALAAEEKEHLATLEGLSAGGAPAAASDAGGAQPVRDVIAARERWHRSGRGGSIRAAVFGINDGLLSNVSLVLGVAAAGADHKALVMTGLAGLMAGAFSMAAGEYVSVASQRDLLERQIALEARELAEGPEEEEAELVAILRQKGLAAEQAQAAARDIMKDPKQALDTLVREELGLDPHDLGSPIAAALASFVMFAVGAAIPLAPFFVASGQAAPIASGVLSGAVLAGVGALLGVLSGTGALRSALRMAGLAALAAGVTIGVGRLIGVSVS